MKYLLIITLTLALLDAPLAQQPTEASAVAPVFIIGEYEEQYFALSQQFPSAFLSIYDNDINVAYRAWSEFLMDIEDYALELNFDLKGVKLWMNLYFNPDGTLAHLGFYPKPNSRNIPEEQLVAFFKNFVSQYHFPEKTKEGFQHSASASFPTFFHRTTPETARSN